MRLSPQPSHPLPWIMRLACHSIVRLLFTIRSGIIHTEISMGHFFVAYLEVYLLSLVLTHMCPNPSCEWRWGGSGTPHTTVEPSSEARAYRHRCVVCVCVCVCVHVRVCLCACVRVRTCLSALTLSTEIRALGCEKMHHHLAHLSLTHDIYRLSPSQDSAFPGQPA